MLRLPRLPAPRPPRSFGAGVAIVAGALALPLAVGAFAGIVMVDATDDGKPAASPSTGVQQTTIGTGRAQPIPATPTKLADADRAQAGQCFAGNARTSAQLRLIPCAVGTFKLLRRISGSADQCGTDTNWAIPAAKATLCLAYQYQNGVGEAPVGECVADNESGDEWSRSPCGPGAYLIIDKYYGRTDFARCETNPAYQLGLPYPHGSIPELDMVLCTRFLYPDDSATAQLNTCLRVVRESGHELLRAGSCVRGNVFVTGRTGKVDKNFCKQDTPWSYEHPRYPRLSYTICIRRI